MSHLEFCVDERLGEEWTLGEVVSEDYQLPHSLSPSLHRIGRELVNTAATRRVRKAAICGVFLSREGRPTGR